MDHPPLETFQIGWICALPLELTAASQMLDPKYRSPDTQDAADPNTYTLGRIGKHDIVIACLPAGQYGETSATMVAINMLRTFKSLRVGLMVGVGGGIPSAAHDIRLGDVVISCPGDTVGGVIQYDMGKVGVAGEFRRTGSLNSPPRSLLTAVSQMRAAEMTDDPIYPEFLNSAIARTERSRNSFGRPSEHRDRLFKPAHEHPASADSCDECLVEWEVTRSQRRTNNPQPHYGFIASGSSVIKHGRAREHLRLTTGALCVEMEAAGLMLDFPCLVVRGICDYADSHKNKQWQGYAALSAAAYAKELLGYIAAGQVSQERLVVDVCKQLKDELQGINQRLDRVYDQQEQHHREETTRALTDQQQKCHQAFKLLNYTELKNINPRREEGTCQWALQSAEYTRWWKGNCSDLLWVSADPGCGKSVLARSIVDDNAASHPELTICYFFFKDNDEQNRLSVALCSVLHQLFSQQPDLLGHALPYWEKSGKKIRQETDELWHILLTATSSAMSCKTICVLDVLDECCEIDQRWLIEKLESFYHQITPSTQDSWLKVLVTSRPYDQIQHGFHTITDSFPYVHLKGEEENELIHEEINLVVKLKVEELARKTSLSPEIQQRLETKLLEMKNRTYLWLRLAINDIHDTYANSLRPDEASIQLVPSSVNAAYSKILSRISSQNVETVKKIFEILIAARRPLSTSEMAMALGIAMRPHCQSASEAMIDKREIDIKLRHLCGLFIFIEESRIYFVHETAKEYLSGNLSSSSTIPSQDYWQHSIMSQIAHRNIAMICVTYLDFLNNEEDETAHLSEVFLNYAATYWGAHFFLAEYTFDDDIIPPAMGICNPTSKAFTTWWTKYWNETAPLAKSRRPPIFSSDVVLTRLMVSSHLGHQAVVEVMLKQGDEVDSGDVTPLSVAAEEGHFAVVELLLRNGAKSESKGIHSPLSCAVEKGHPAVVEILLESGADIESRCQDNQTPLALAAMQGHLAVVELYSSVMLKCSQNRVGVRYPRPATTAMWLSLSSYLRRGLIRTLNIVDEHLCREQ